MGGGSYDRDVGTSSSSGGFSSGGTSSYTAKKSMNRTSMDSATSPRGRRVESKAKSPVVIVLDGTGSNTEMANIFWDKAPMLYGQIEQQGYLDDFDICFAICGDANKRDRAPLQVAEFKKGKPLDKELKKLFLEGGGGGGGNETYELAAHYFAEKCDMPNAEMPFLFILGDERAYETLRSTAVEKVLGESQPDLESKVVFDNVFKKFDENVFYLQNLYCGEAYLESTTQEFTQHWKDMLGKKREDHVIRLYEEKSAVDVILGVIAYVSGARDKNGYTTDMTNRGQTKTRVANVNKSLGGMSTALVRRADVQLPVVATKKKKSKARRL